ncbi:MAG: hypothetical protein IJD28_04220, partial [Deferribacterales bacterium]|nr:hypothetical protein [Deferribacterales bacterium]
MKKHWHKLDERSVFKNPVVHVTEKDFHYDAVNDSMPFTVVKMNNWSLIVPVTADNEFIAVRQFRAGPEDDTLEFPGGSIDPHETPAQAA